MAGIGLQLTGDPYLDALINSANSGGIMSQPLSPETTNTVITLGNAANTSQVTQTSLQGSNTLSSNILDIFGRGGLFDNPLHIAGYAAIAYSIYKMSRRRRLSLPQIALLAFGIWQSGIWNDYIKPNLFPQGVSKTSLVTLAAAMLPGTIGRVATSAFPLVAGAGGLLAGILIPIAINFWKKRLMPQRSFRRQRFSYRKRFYPRRRYYRRAYAR